MPWHFEQRTTHPKLLLNIRSKATANHSSTHNVTMFSRPRSSMHDAISSTSSSVKWQKSKSLGCDRTQTHTASRVTSNLVVVKWHGGTIVRSLIMYCQRPSARTCSPLKGYRRSDINAAHERARHQHMYCMQLDQYENQQ